MKVLVLWAVLPIHSATTFIIVVTMYESVFPMTNFRFAILTLASAMVIPAAVATTTARAMAAEDELVVVGSRYPVPEASVGNATTIIDEEYIKALTEVLIENKIDVVIIDPLVSRITVELQLR